jgi:hypothetical protein
MPRQACGDGEIRPALSPAQERKALAGAVSARAYTFTRCPGVGFVPRRTVFFKGRMVNKRLLDDNSFSFVAAPTAGRELIG